MTQKWCNHLPFMFKELKIIAFIDLYILLSFVLHIVLKGKRK